MLALDRTIGCIEAAASEVLDLYRSVPITMSCAAGTKPASMEAYVCAIREKAGVKVYLALVADDRRIYVYTEPGKFDSEEGFKDTLQEALAFARSMGFSPEPVALSYSPAMREVVVRNMKILRAPGAKVRAVLKHGTADAPTPALMKSQNTVPRKNAAASPAAPPITTPASPATPPASVAAPVTAPAAATKLKAVADPDHDDETTELSAVRAISDLKKGLKVVAAEKDAQSLELQELSELHQIALAELAGAREESARVAAERDELAQDKKQLRAVASERDAVKEQLQAIAAEKDAVKEQLQKVAAERDAAKAELGELAALHQAATAELAGAWEGCDRLNAEKDKLAARAQKQVDAVTAERDGARDQLRELTALHQAATVELECAREECARLSAEKEKQAAQEKQQLLKVTAERDAAREQLRELTALHQTATEELKEAREECARLSAGKDKVAAQDKKQLEALATERDAAKDQLRELAALHQAAAAELKSASEECARLSAEKVNLAAHDKKQLEALAAERDATASQLGELSALHQAATAQLKSAREECARLTEERDALKGSSPSADQASPELTSLHMAVAVLSRQIEEMARRKAEPVAESAAPDAATVGVEQHALRSSTATGAEGPPPATVRTESSQPRVTEAKTAQPETAQPEMASLEPVALEPALAEPAEPESAALQPAELQTAEPETADPETAEVEAAAGAEYSAGEPLPPRDQQVPAPEAAQPQDSVPAAHFPDFASFQDFSSDLPLNGFGNFSSAAQKPEFAGSQPTIQATEFTPFADLQDFSAPGSEDDSPARFLLSSDMTAIECLSLDEVVELHQSINNAYLSPQGKGQESCRGYICGLRKGKSVRVYAAIFGTQSGRTSVYVPEVQPEDDQSYTRTVKGAITFAEEVGLMMEQVKLGASSVKQRDSLLHCPVLKSAEQESSEGPTKH